MVFVCQISESPYSYRFPPLHPHWWSRSAYWLCIVHGHTGVYCSWLINLWVFVEEAPYKIETRTHVDCWQQIWAVALFVSLWENGVTLKFGVKLVVVKCITCLLSNVVTLRVTSLVLCVSAIRGLPRERLRRSHLESEKGDVAFRKLEQKIYI